MTRALRIAALCAAALLAACGNDNAVSPGLNLAEPSAVVPFRGVTTKDPGNKVHPYLAIANAATNDLTVIDAVDDSIVYAPVPLRALVIPVPGRPALLASADLGDGGPDLLVAVSAGDSRLQLIRTWSADNAVVQPANPAPLDLGADVLALATVPSPQGTARIAAALVDRRIRIVDFGREAGDAIEPRGHQEATFGFQAVALAALPDRDPLPGAVDTKLYAASLEEIAIGVQGVAELSVPTGAPPSLLQPLDAGAPTRLVTAARVRERLPGSFAADASAFGGEETIVERAYAVLDESGCGVAAPIACGLVALDPALGGLAVDPAGELPHRAPIPIPGQPLALAAAPPPALPPSDVEPQYAVTFMRVQTAVGARATPAVAAVASTNGSVTFVDLGRWEIPSEQAVHTNVGATVTPGTTASDQWLVLVDPATSTTVAHGEAQKLAAAVVATRGYTPTARWTVTYQSALPGLSSRRAHAPGGGLLALQVPGTVPAFTEIVRLYDPVLGVQVGDVAVVEAGGLAGCNATFEAEVDDFIQPIPTAYPGGAVRLRKKLDPSHPEWDACVDALAGEATGLRATFLAGGYVLVRGSGSSALHVGRPRLGEPFDVRWLGEVEPECTLVPWPAAPASCDTACRTACERLLASRMSRRIAYPEPCGTDGACQDGWYAPAAIPGDPRLPLRGPALRFTLALETAVAPPRGLTLAIDTRDGRTPFQVVPASGAPVEPRSIATFDRSPYDATKGVRFLVPYAGGLVLDATPTVQGGNAVVIR